VGGIAAGAGRAVHLPPARRTGGGDAGPARVRSRGQMSGAGGQLRRMPGPRAAEHARAKVFHHHSTGTADAGAKNPESVATVG